ncbi:hypothetical protein EDD18DRAFT_1360514 [Armillaria luteobubalina]|uniref:Uncharacterized protein n=1 Tax=Armillaria luteobubalina TaxID=153913 RepID=A0AA39UGS0_9AGAR|nr:hypothetical protein EDD18DRAFT_1360514 [Armillaria luteobubalina]
MEPTGNIGFTAATGFGHDEGEFLAQNSVYLHILETGELVALSDTWFKTIWQQHVLYWPLQDRSDKGLIDHHKHVRYALRWLFDALDPDTHKQALATVEPKLHPPGPPQLWPLTFQRTMTHMPQIDLFKPPTAEEIVKSKAVKAAKYAV